MKKILIVIIFVLIGQISYAEDLNKPYIPTRAEWLEYCIHKDIVKTTQVWELRYCDIIKIDEKNNDVIVGISLPNKAETLNKEQQEWTIKIIKNIVKSTLDQFDWAINLKVHVHFI
ncbi:MAG TPA: hypothetical protein DCP51_00375 [Clostridiales bacterium]|nr:MAG: hypothetical protein A2X42_04090 [Candidatus Margulisbacteria bacterium GWF2_38_17]OGI07165.1 MAG: hypothetical protein A2X41_06160 [Candidatus Margulisbacteria bacterium GWE2_39_32]HAN20129.1 hypothetical protein [Clostridiales bacterium]HCT84720.1 hypothetical protein [Candidatus Margulisiibacteriota bacterium]